MTRLLVVEDEPAQQVALQTMLGSRGYHVAVAGTANDAAIAAAALAPDLVLLDLGLPDGDGIALCRHLRTLSRCPIIVVSADSLEDRIVMALDGGADDYVVKPYLPRVLLARIRVALRHAETAAALVRDDRLICGDVVVDVAAHEVRIAGEPHELQARVFAALTVLMRNAGKVVTFRTLTQALGAAPDAVDLNALRIVISKLRKHLGTGPSRPTILTELGVGYRLEPPAED